METVDGIGGVFLYADDAAKLARWYREVLGVPLVFNEEEKNNWYTVYGALDEKEAGRKVEVVFAIFQADAPMGKGRTQARVNWRVRNMEEMLRQLKSNGVEVERRSEHSYGVFVWVRDPEENAVEMWEPT